MPKRSQVIHMQPDSQKRRRVYAACTECRRRRRKCDGNELCASCDGYGYICTYGASPRKPGDTSHNITENTAPVTNRLTVPVPAPVSVPIPTSVPTPVPVAMRGPTPIPASTDSSRTSHTSHAAPCDTPSQNVLPASVVVSRERGRFINAHSAVALPHLVGIELGAENLPRLHSYAWNLGIRQERRGVINTALSNYLSFEACHHLSSVYFTSVHPLFSFLSQETYYTQLQQKWDGLETDPSFAAVVAGVALLGSFFSESAHPHEESIKQYCFSTLDFAFSSPVSMIDMDSVAGWILRAIYTRSTTHPAVACLASHTAMQMVEILSLHRDVDSGSNNVSASTTAQFTAEEIDTRRRYHQVAWFLDTLLSFEYGTTPIKLSHADFTPMMSQMSIHIEYLSIMARVLHDVDRTIINGLASQEITDAFLQIAAVPSTMSALALFKGAACLCILRRFVSEATKPGPVASTAAIGILQDALKGIHDLLNSQHPWWNIIMVPFHTICVCLSFDTDAYLALLPPAMELLRTLVNTYGTHMTKDALNTAQQLVAASRNNTDSKLKMKDVALSHGLTSGDVTWYTLDQSFDGMDNWPLGLDFMPYRECKSEAPIASQYIRSQVRITHPPTMGEQF